MNKRSDKKIITIEAKIIKYLRNKKGISQRTLSQKIPFSATTIAHLESGRMDMSPKRLSVFLDYFGCTNKDFECYKSGKTKLPDADLDRCLILLRKLPEEKLSAIQSVLENF